MATIRSQYITHVLSVYVESKLESAALEMIKAKRWVELERNAYTEGRLKWCEHQFAALKIVARDVPVWRSVVKRYKAKLKRRRKQRCRESQPQSQP